jgi:hypothetical protein
MEVWTPGKLDQIAGRASTSAIRIVERFEKTAITPTDVPGDADSKAWGQYLDDEHHSDSQWGFYGTSAGIQALMMKQRVFGTDPERINPLIMLALKQLPADISTTDSRFEHKRSKGDFENIIKLAFIADALEPHDDDVADQPPPVVSTILSLAVNKEFWSSRVATDKARLNKERIFPTACILLVLQRYRAARGDSVYKDARLWLAERVVQDHALDTPANNALIGLALLDRHETKDARPHGIATALQSCEDRLLEWTDSQRTIVIDRPIFYGFSLGTRTDYSFLHPELLTALFLLRRGNPPKGRAYVLRVMKHLTDNIINHNGFVGQNGVMSSVDQMWAMRLIAEFRAVRDSDDGRQRLLPVRDQRVLLRDNRSRVVAVIVVLLVALGFALATSTSFVAGIGAWTVAVLMLLGNVFAIPVKGD